MPNNPSSFLDAASGDPAAHRYEVVSVEHELSDVTAKEPMGAHKVTVHVKPGAEHTLGGPTQ